jgi:predicted Zn-dependent protease
MFSCPACGSQDVAGRTVCKCGADLSLLDRVEQVADAWFNRALEELAAGHEGRALEWLSACCAARPNDAEARRAQGKVWARMGRWTEALDSFDRAEALDPGQPETSALRMAVLQEIQRNSQEAGSRPGVRAAGNRKAKTHARRKGAAR